MGRAFPGLAASRPAPRGGWLGMGGRLTPVTGELKVVSTPSQNTYPYGIRVNSRGVPWYVDFRGNRVASVDPVTMEIREYPLPDPAARPRRIAITPDDVVWE